VSLPVQPAEPPRPRPTIVTVAGWLLLGVGILQLISMVVGLSQLGTIADVYETAYRGTDQEDAARTGAVGGTVVASVLGGVLGIAYIVLTIFNNRGKNPARITTWVLAGIGACCGVVGLIGSALGGSFGMPSGDDLPDPDEVQRQLEDALPSWYNPVLLTLGVIGLLALLAVIILLALPPANEFFRKPQPAWQPPVYPQAGAYPQPSGSYPPPAAPPAPAPPAPPASGGQPPAGQPPAGGQSEGGQPPAGPPAPGGPPA